MKLLLDTHTVLWFVGNDSQLSAAARENIENPAHEKFVSAASLWEIALKLSLEKLKLPLPFDEVFPRQLEVNGFELLPISCAQLNVLAGLPFHHRDPFDRLLIAQAVADRMIIVTRDQAFSKYPAKIMW
ncbi:MAG TPA: type II toxin-antitoxin system VapC family toxin [Candidatus Saccharimonadales bacterium]|nr:type II toxin-antitoxin system VapC family toxin [Candidatus Saccharimonadales bacterium]